MTSVKLTVSNQDGEHHGGLHQRPKGRPNRSKGCNSGCLASWCKHFTSLAVNADRVGILRLGEE